MQGKGLLGFNKIVCENQYTGETTTTEINFWNTDYYTPEIITQTIKHDTLVTTTETEYSITDLGGKNFCTYPSNIKNTDIYGDVVVSQHTYNTEHGYLENTETYYPDGYCKLLYYGDYVEAGRMCQPQLSTYIQKTPDDPEGFITKKHFEYDANTGTLTKQTDNYGTSKQVATEYKYDEFGNVIHTDIYGDGTEKITTDYTYENQRLVLWNIGQIRPSLADRTIIQAVETEVRNMLMYYIDMYKLIYNPEKEWNNVNRKLFDSQLKIIFPK